MAAPLTANLKPATLAPYFIFAGLVHAAAVASRYDALAAKLPAGAPLAIMLAQFPLLLLSGYFEGRLDYGERANGFPLWMSIDSKAVKMAFAFGFMYLVVVAAQTWDLHIGPIDPTPPKEFPAQQRAMWFAMFTLGFFFLFYMAAASLLIPVLRVLTKPLRMVPAVVGAVIALVVGGGVGLVVMSAVSSTKLSAFIKTVQGALGSDPAITVGVSLAMTLGPLLIGLVFSKQDEE